MEERKFYLELAAHEGYSAREPHENPSVGIILCKSKGDDVVKFAMNKNLSQTMISEYRTQLIDKEILRKRLSEICDNTEEGIEEDDISSKEGV